MKIKDSVKKACLPMVPQEFWDTEETELALMVGGCGPGKWGDRLVPDTIWGLSVTPACAIHDFMYSLHGDKAKADRWFLFNMLHIVNTQSKSRILKWLRRYRIMSYYSAVSDLGGGSFSRAGA